MIYLICQDWSNTSNNHAGIKYLCNQIQEMYPESYKTFVIPAFWNDRSKSPIRIIASLQYHFARYKHRLYKKVVQSHNIKATKRR